MLFNFALVPLDSIEPWGNPGEYNLHWFGLTDGEYWILAGEHVLLEYSDALRRDAGAPHYCSYQVARLHEDVMKMAARVLEPVPPNLMPYMSGERGQAWRAGYGARMAMFEEHLDDERVFALVDNSSTWISDRCLDTAYLSPSANIWMWSDETTVHIEWDNRDRLHKGLPAWSACVGSHRIGRATFETELRAFHGALMEQMGRRKDEVLAGALPVDVQVDLPALEREHARRSRTIEEAIARPSSPTDWAAVASAISEIERGGIRPHA
jgi:hypothetical protein